MKKTKIVVGIILALVLLIVGLGFYKFNFSDDDIYFSGENIQPESYKVFQGSWILENSEFEEGFTLNEDSTASSINMATLLYKKWKIEDSKLTLTAVSCGNHTGSVFDEKYVIKSFNHKGILLEKNDKEYFYKKSNQIIKTDTSYNTSLSTSFEYFPVDVSKTSSTKHPIDFTSNSRAPKFKTVISEKYDVTSINFGGYYIIAFWGCGSGCLEGIMIDTRDGKVYNLPTKKGYVDFGNDIEMSSNSILLATKFVNSTYIPNTKNREVEITFWLWNESAKEFVNYTTLNKIIKE